MSRQDEYLPFTVTATPTITAGAYAAGDAVGGKLTFSNVADGSGRSILINTLVLKDLAKQLASLQLVLFNQDFTATLDNDPFDPTDADLANCCGIIPITGSDYGSFNDNAVAVVRSVGLELALSGSNDLYGQLFTVSSTPTYASTSDISVTLVGLQV